MAETVKYALNKSVATITLDDGKVNVLGPAMQSAINEALDRAKKDSAKAIVIAGTQRAFSDGFDPSVFESGDPTAVLGMFSGGFELSVRCLTFSVPVIMAATGSAISMGSFLLLSGDYRVGQPESRCQAMEVAMGMTVPNSAIEIMRARLTPAAFQRGTSMASTFVGADAVAGGWLDEIVAADRVVARAQEVAAEAAATLHPRAHLATKLKTRDSAVKAIKAGIDPKEFFSSLIAGLP